MRIFKNKKIIEIIFIFLAILIVALLSGCTIRIAYDYYSYIDYNGNEGRASECYSNYGNMTCVLSDDTRIKVVQYKGEYNER